MRFPWFKVILFLCVWYEIAVELHVSDGVALGIAILILAAWRYMPRLIGHFFYSLGPLTCGLLAGLVFWLVVYWLVAPHWLREIPMMLTLGGAALLALIGARCRGLVLFHGVGQLKAKLREHSGLVLLLALAVTCSCFYAVRHMESAWVLVGYAALPGLPFWTGWQLAQGAGPTRPDAKFGDARTFRDAGFSEDR